MGSAPPVGAGFSPLDDELGLLPGQLTPRLQEGLVRLSTLIPSFAKATTEFAFWTQVEVHRTTTGRLTEAAGATAVALQTAEAEAILRTHPHPPHTSTRLVLSVDGAMVPLLQGQWGEVRTLAIGEAICLTSAQTGDTPAKPRCQQNSRHKNNTGQEHKREIYNIDKAVFPLK